MRFMCVTLVLALSIGCASVAQRHPLLSPVGQKAAIALDVLGIAEKASTALKASVDTGAVRMSQGIADALNLLSAVGDVARDIGVALDVYNKATIGAAQIQAAATLDGKIALLDSLVSHMPVTHIEQAVRDLAAKVKQLKGANR